MTDLTEFDGPAREWLFGYDPGRRFKATATSRAAAVAQFRAGCLFPHELSKQRICDNPDALRENRVYLSAEPGATVKVGVSVAKPYGRPDYKEVGEIPVVDPLSEYDPSKIPASVRLVTTEGPESDCTALVQSDSSLRPSDVPRPLLAQAVADLQNKRDQLQRAADELRQQIRQAQAEMTRRQRQCWAIELFLGTKERVVQLRRGAPAPAGTKTTVHQRVLCMDEELAVWHLLEDPTLLEEFDASHIEAFDAWLLADPSHLDQILPQSKGIVALRVRRNPKRRVAIGGLAEALQRIAEEEADRMTYLLIRNGEQLSRVWADVSIWPRLFPRADEWDPDREQGGRRRSEEVMNEERRQVFAGLLVLQGLAQRSELLDPIAKDVDIFDASMEEHFECLRNDEHLAIGEGTVEFKQWRRWLGSKAQPGARVLFHTQDRGSLEERTGLATVHTWPKSVDAHTLVTPERRYRGKLEFLYLPDEDYWHDASATYRVRKKRIRFSCYGDEVWPVEYIDWPTVRTFLSDRSQRHHYFDLFPAIGLWVAHVRDVHKAESAFVDLALSQAGLDQSERPRAERCLRWWKLRTKTHRTIGTDEAKALRMVVQALCRGDDHSDDLDYRHAQN